MAKVFARFDAVTKDCRGQSSSSSMWSGLPEDPKFIYKGLEDKLDNVNDWFLNGSGEITEKLDMGAVLDKNTIAADGVDTATISGIPLGTIIIIYGLGDQIIETVDDGLFEITCDASSVISIQMTKDNCKPMELGVVAT